MKTARILIPTFLLFIAALNINAQVTDKRIEFEKGKSSATIHNAIPRGYVDSYLLGASSSQYMTVTIKSVEKNGVFQIIDKSTGNFLPGAEEDADAQRWEGYLPSTGDYEIIVGSIRGGSTYTLKVKIE